MPLDPNIALSFQPTVKLQNPLELYAQQAQMQDAQQRNALHQYAMQKAQQEQEAQNALASAYQGAVGPDGQIDRNKLFALMAGGRAAAHIPKVQEQYGKADEQKAKTDKERAETVAKIVQNHKDLLGSVKDPQSYAAWRQSLVSQIPTLDGMVPRDFNPQIIPQLAMKADELVARLSPKLDVQSFGGYKQGVNPYTGATAGPQTPMTMTPGEMATDARARSSQAQAERHFQETSKREQLSQPFDVQGPDGTNILVQQDKKSGQIIDVNTKQPVGGVGPKMSAEAQTSLREVDKLKTTLDRMIKTYKPEYVGAKGMAGEFSDQYLSQAPLVGDKFGDKDRVNFRQNASTVVNDYIKAITGATVGQSGEQQRLMRAVPAPNDSDIVFKAKMDEMRRNLDELPNIIAGKKSSPKGGGWSIKRVD